MKKAIFFICCFVLMFGLLVGCGKEIMFSSEPPVQILDTEIYTARLEPVRKENSSIYTTFRLTITNNTDRELEIVWDRCRYLYNDKPNGRWLFEGITEKNLRNQPSDFIVPGGSLSRQIWPAALFAWEKIASSEAKSGETGIRRGAIPAGKNGIGLLARQDGNEIKKTIGVMITATEI